MSHKERKDIIPIPNSERKCTNPIFLLLGIIIFIILLYSLIKVSIYSNISAIGRPLDPNNNFCGVIN